MHTDNAIQYNWCVCVCVWPVERWIVHLNHLLIFIFVIVLPQWNQNEWKKTDGIHKNRFSFHLIARPKLVLCVKLFICVCLNESILPSHWAEEIKKRWKVDFEWELYFFRTTYRIYSRILIRYTWNIHSAQQHVSYNIFILFVHLVEWPAMVQIQHISKLTITNSLISIIDIDPSG